MRKAASIIPPVLAIALLAALAALWPLEALAGPPAQTVPGAPPDGGGQIAPDPAPARIQGLDFAAFPRSGDYTAGENIRVTVKFDHNVTVSGQPQLALDIGGQQRWAAYYHGSGARNLKFAYLVHPSDWDGNGVSVPAGSIALNGGSITSGSNVAATLSHSGIADDGSRKVQGSPDSSPSFGSAAISSQSYQKSAEITALTLPAATGGNGLLTYSLDLPAGLVFNAAARTISGKPTTTQNAVSYTYAATDADGDAASLSFTITVDGAPTFGSDSTALPAQTYAKGAAIATRTFPTAADGNTPLTYSLTPAPPDGLVFNAAARTISGKPTTTQNAVSYTYTVTDADGDTDTLSLDITVDGAPSFPADAVGAQTYVKGVAITRLGLPAATDGNTPLNYTLTPALPDGLVFDTATRTITGTPTTTQNAVSYTYTVTDADGDTDTQSFAITVDGAPSFASDAAVGAQTYPKGVAITSLTLPAATDGNTPLTYSLSPTPPDGLVFSAATRVLSGTPTTGQAATRYTYTVTDADTDTATLSFTIEVTGDYDLDDDGLIEIDRLAQLNAVRWDLNGDGSVDTGTSVADTAKYSAAFAGASAGMGCLRDHDDDATTAKVAGCIGYELTRDLDFDTDGDGATYATSSTGVVSGDAGDAYYNGGKGWKPIGDLTNRFTAIFYGNRKTISNLFIKDTAADRVGLFGVVGTGGRVERLGMLDVNVAGRYSVGGLVGSNVGTIIASYVTGTVTGTSRVGGLAGWIGGTGPLTRAIVSASYATGSVTGASRGGLVGENGTFSTIVASYATGSVSLVGTNASSIRASYTAGGGSLVGWSNGGNSAVTSYWDETAAQVGQPQSNGYGFGKTTRELQSPTGYSGIYAGWNIDVDNADGDNNTATGVDNPWDFGTSSQYPALRYGGLVPALQRPVSVSVQSVNGNTPIVGGPVTATFDSTGVTGITWQWQSSADGSTWTDIANATGATYSPVAADAASGGKHLRVSVSFTAWETSRTATSDRTAKVVSNANVPVIAAASAPIVGEKLRYYLSTAGVTHRTAWQWRRCDDAAMTSNCVLRAQSNSASDAHTEYTPAAGTNTDVGKYLQAYAYYAANDAGKTWTRTESPVLGPVVAAPAAPTVSQ